MLFLGATGKNDVLLAHLDLLCGIADAMRTGGAGRTDGIVDTFDLGPGRETGRNPAAHSLGDHVGTDTAHPLFTQRIDAFLDARMGCATCANNQAGAHIGHQLGR